MVVFQQRSTLLKTYHSCVAFSLTIVAILHWSRSPCHEVRSMIQKLEQNQEPIVGRTEKKLSRVLHLINGEHYSGAERVQDLLGLALREFGYEAGFVCLKDGKFPKQRQSQDCPLYVQPMRSKIDFRTVKNISETIKQENYSVVHAHTPRSLMVGRMVARKTGCPLVYHVHSPVGRDSTRGFHNKVNQWIENWSLKQCDAMVCVSNSLKNYMIESGHSRSKLHVVQNGVCSVDKLPDRPQPSSQWTLGTTALFRPRKGTEMLLKALAEIKSRGLNVRLLAVGPFESKQYESEIKSLAEELNVADLIEWTGFQTDVNKYFQEMDLFVLPSLFGEGLPMVILEAMANGVPVVAADVEGVAEAVRHETDGLVFEPGNVEALAESIQQMVACKFDWHWMRSSAIERQRESFSELSMAAGVAQVYTQLLKGSM